MMSSFDWTATLNAFAISTMLALLIERALSILFEAKKLEGVFTGWKEVLAVIVAWVICYLYELDLLATMFDKDIAFLGTSVTSMAIAGGGKGFVKLFHDVLDVKNSTEINSK